MSKSDSGRRTPSRADADVAFVEALAKVLRDNDLAELEVTREYGERDELQVRLARYAEPAPVMAASAPPMAVAAAAPLTPVAPLEAGAAPVAAAASPLDNPDCVTSPMVGTVYLAPEPDAADFVSVGDTVTEGQTLLIVEAMKTMNQIPSPRAGVVREILVSNEQPVEFGAPLMIVS